MLSITAEGGKGIVIKCVGIANYLALLPVLYIYLLVYLFI